MDSVIENTETKTLGLISKEVAKQDIERWLASKKIGSLKREKYAGNILVLEEAVIEGYLTINDKGELKQTLRFPIGIDFVTSELKYKSRLTVDERAAAVESAEGNRKIEIYQHLYALTGEVAAFFGKLDTEDYSICNSIVVFFI